MLILPWGGNDYGSNSGDNNHHKIYYGLIEDNTWAVEFDYGVVYGRASCQAYLEDPVFYYMDSNAGAIFDGVMSPDQVRSDLTPIVGAAKANDMADVAAGIADGTIMDDDAFYEAVLAVLGLPKDASTDILCHCQMTGFLSEPSDEYGYYDMSRVVAIESPWVFGTSYSSESKCASECAKYCGESVMENGDFRKALFGTIRLATVATCNANRIKIEWTDATDEDIAANNAGMCTYGGDIRTPIKAATKPGKTFVGWKFSMKAE